MEPKKYGLIKLNQKNPPKAPKLLQKTSSVFGNDSDSEDDDNQMNTNPMMLQIYNQSSNKKRQTKTNIKNAMDIDPTIFQYDEIYDEIKQQQQHSKSTNLNKEQMDKKPKYINNLLKMAETRKIENELRFERKIQKERENEGEEFKDKESFVTSAYRNKLEEMRKTYEEMEKQDHLEKMLDVTKHQDMNGFYRSLYKNDMFKEKDSEETKDRSEEKIVFNKSRNKSKIRQRDINDDDNDVDDDQIGQEMPKKKSKKSDKEKETKIDNQKKDDKKKESADNITEQPPSENPPEIVKDDSSTKNPDKTSATETMPESQPSESSEPPKPKLTRAELIEKLFTKRTIGDVFEQARQRYLERRQQRLIEV